MEDRPKRRPRGPNKIPRKGNTAKSVIKRRRIEEAMKRIKYHRIEWITATKAICGACGIFFNMIQTTELGKPGWLMKDVWGGDENGMGGVFKEPPCSGG